jgi:repressor LexA
MDTSELPALTARQQQVLRFIADTLARTQIPPSWQEIASAFEIASTRAVQKHLLLLQDKGYLQMLEGQRRGIRLTDAALALLPHKTIRTTQKSERATGFIALPVLGRVAAGAPISADAHKRATLLQLDATLFKPKPDYLLRVKGDSMRDEGILDGDLVAIQQSQSARNGAIVVARIEDEITIKKLQLGTNERGIQQIRLLPRNSEFAPIAIDATQNFAIVGLYCGLIRTG